MKFPWTSSPTQARRIKQELARPEENLSFELGKAVKELPPIYTRVLSGTISALLVAIIAWAHFSKIDEVAVAAGDLIPSVQVRPVRSVQEGKVSSVKVREGDRVTLGQVLVQLDSKLSQTEIDNLEKSARLIREDLARLEAERTGSKNTGTYLQDQLLAARLQEFDNKRDSATAEANKQIATIDEAKIRLARLQENLLNAKTTLMDARLIFGNAQSSLRNAQVKEKGLRTLVSPENGAIPRVDYLDAQNRVIQAQSEVTKAKDGIIKAQDTFVSTEKEIAGQLQKIRQAEQGYQVALQEANRVSSERQSGILAELNKRREELTTTEGKLKQARSQKEQSTITAPVNGTVYGIKVTTGGGTVQTGEELLSILPDGEEILLEVKLLNRDVGFISQGMKAKVKMAAFPYQEFGSVEGTVVQISPNAISDEDLGLVFPTRIKLNKNIIQVRGRNVQLAPGMSGTGEIITREKSILTFMIEPIARRVNEGFSVR